MSDLSKFLLDRIAEDEVVALRSLSECEAKRRILDLATGVAVRIGRPLDADDDMFHVLRLLALPYAEHPSYRQEWKA